MAIVTDELGVTREFPYTRKGIEAAEELRKKTAAARKRRLAQNTAAAGTSTNKPTRASVRKKFLDNYLSQAFGSGRFLIAFIASSGSMPCKYVLVVARLLWPSNC